MDTVMMIFCFITLFGSAMIANCTELYSDMSSTKTHISEAEYSNPSTFGHMQPNGYMGNSVQHSGFNRRFTPFDLGMCSYCRRIDNKFCIHRYCLSGGGGAPPLSGGNFDVNDASSFESSVHFPNLYTSNIGSGPEPSDYYQNQHTGNVGSRTEPSNHYQNLYTSYIGSGPEPSDYYQNMYTSDVGSRPEPSDYYQNLYTSDVGSQSGLQFQQYK